MDPKALNDLKQTAWVGAQAELAGIDSRVRGKIEPTDTQPEIVETYAEEMLPYLIGHLTRSEAACALAVAKGIFPAPVIGGLMASLRGFVQAAASGRRAFCSPPCSWKGEVGEAGPIGICPTCGKAPVSMVDIVVPPSTNGRLIITD